MSKILEQALERAKALPDSRQDEIGEMILDVVDQDQSDMRLTAAQQDEVRRRLGEPRPVFATDEQVKALFRRFAD
jgi:hypothetical protein